jgi:hypothetical protein
MTPPNNVFVVRPPGAAGNTAVIGRYGASRLDVTAVSFIFLGYDVVPAGIV